MTIDYITELQRLVIVDSKKDCANLQLVQDLLMLIETEIQLSNNTLLRVTEILSVDDLLNVFSWISNNLINLESYADVQILSNIYDSLQDDYFEDSLSVVEKLLWFKYLDKDFLIKIKLEGSVRHYNMFRKLHCLANKGLYKYVVSFLEHTRQLEELAGDLQREKRKFEMKIYSKEQLRLLSEIQEVKSDYTKDCVLLITGLLETEGNYYYTLRAQLDEQFRNKIEEKIARISKLLNLQDSFSLDGIDIKKTINNIKVKNDLLRKELQKFLLRD